MYNVLWILGSSYHFINDHIWLHLWYGHGWGEGRTPELTGKWDPGVANKWDEIEASRVYRFHINPAALRRRTGNSLRAKVGSLAEPWATARGS